MSSEGNYNTLIPYCSFALNSKVTNDPKELI